MELFGTWFPTKEQSFVFITNELGMREKVDKLEAWIMKLNMGKRSTKYATVCSLHFTKDDFILPGVPTKRPCLKRTAVPSQNLHFFHDIITGTMDRSESGPPEIENSDNKLKRKYDPLALDNEQELPEIALKKWKNAEKCKRYRERKKAEAPLFSALKYEQEEPSKITLKKKKNAEKCKRYRERKKAEALQFSGLNNEQENDDMINDAPIRQLHQLQSTFTQQYKSSFVQVQPSAASIRYIKLHQENTANFKKDIISGGELYGEHINNFQDIIASRFLNFRPIDVHLIALPQFVRPISHLRKHIQIISGVSGQPHQITHWICTYYDGNVINIYDSLNRESLYPEMEFFFNRLFPHKPQYKFHGVRQQPNNTDCGVYAIAFATSLLNNRDPSKENYHHLKMRSHLLDIYSTTELLPFPNEPYADAQKILQTRQPLQEENTHLLLADWISYYRKKPTMSLDLDKFMVKLRASFKNTRHCKICPFSTTSLCLMVSHLKGHPSLQQFNCETNNIELYSCLKCPFQTDLAIALKQHFQARHTIRKEHPEDEKYVIKSYICKECQFETHFVMKWLKHTMSCHTIKKKRAKSVDEKDVKWYECRECPFKTKIASSLNGHVYSQHFDGRDIKWFQCEMCPT
ncbi:uncharacterized protein LOC135140714 isoform X2 [Zophobas morio]|uniref:uncharacterized protein LOC135140714 isoform X2 n=1 Tax=Zophobas morio TaxID=2755281 RepID=UPI003082F96C